jgi:hypothetical protein
MFNRKSIALTVLLFCYLLFSSNVKTYAQNTWQQQLNYQINVKLNDDKHFLNGDIRIVYHNESEQQLSEIWMHVWPNAFKNNESSFAKQKLEDKNTKFEYSKNTERGYMDSLQFLVNGFPVQVISNEEFPDIIKLILPTSLQPKDSIIITTPFRVKLPYTFSRIGHVEQSYQISQWYPKPAVYDQKGWHPIPYLDQGEFYAEYATYDVHITLPQNYVVGATGELQNPEENQFLDSISKATLLITEYSSQDTFPTSSKTLKTLHYKQSNVHDFAWFADKRFHVLTSEVELPQSKRKVKTYVLFTNKYAKYWKDASSYINDAVYYYSLWNGDYPYNYCTAVDGALSAGGGMEYPMITVIGEVGSAKTLDRVIAHEVGHNWFYGILGSNEREHPWMDEGINTFYEVRYMRKKYSDGKMIPAKSQNALSKIFGLNYFPNDYESYLLYEYTASCGKAQALNTHAEQFTTINYGTIAYTKTALALRYLEQYLGTALFDSTMHIYYNTWKFRHPYPEDMKAVFEKTTGENMSWFFDELINASKDPEFKLMFAKKKNQELQVKVKNTSAVPGPVFVSTYDKKGNLLETQRTAPFIESAYLYFDNKEVRKVVVDPLYMIPEKNRNNNTIQFNTPLKKVEPLRLQLLGSATRPDKTNLFFMPTIGYNNSDGWMPGLALYNNVFPFKNVEWIVVPMYGLRSKRLNGTGAINHYAYPEKFQEIKTSFHFSSFSTLNLANLALSQSFELTYQKYAIGSTFTLKPSSARSRVREKIAYRIIHTRETAVANYDDGTLRYTTTSIDPHNYLQLTYSKENTGFFRPYQFTFLYEYANTLNKLFPNTARTGTDLQHHKLLAVYKQKFNYKESKKGVSVRLFAGTIFTNTSANGQSDFFSLSGYNDYTYDRAFFNRNDFNRHQFYEIDGAFKSYTYSPPVRNMIGVNLKAPLKTKLPIGLFADAAFSKIDQTQTNFNFDVDFGIYLPIASDVIEVYFPIVTSQRSYNPDQYKDVIRFMIDLQSIEPFGLRRRLQIL